MGASRMNEKLLTTREAAAILNVSVAFLERDRWAGAQIPYITVGTRAVRYRPSELGRYLERQTTSRQQSERPAKGRQPSPLGR